MSAPVSAPGLTPASLARDVRALAASEPAFAAELRAHGTPPMWARPATLETLVHVVLEQKISIESAAAVMARVRELVAPNGGAFDAAALARAPVEALRGAGATAAKVRCLHALAAAVGGGALDLDALAGRPDDEVVAALVSVPGIGPWTAGVWLTTVLRRPDAWPPGDRALAVGAAETFGLDAVPSYPELDRLAARWRPYRGAACRLLWHAYLCRRSR